MKFNVILLGPAGTGKSTALRTLSKVCSKVMILSTEPGVETLFGDDGKYPQPAGKFGWHYIAPARPAWSAMIDNAKKINILSYEGLAKIGKMHGTEYQQFIELLECLSDFVDERTGDKLGPVDSWPEDWCLAIDGLTGLSNMAMQLVVGGKPAKSQPDWQISQDSVYQLLTKLVGDTKCSFVLISHIEREENQVTGANEITVSTLGRKLAPKLPPLFDEVILASRIGTTFTWDTAAGNSALKTRRLPISDKLLPDFGQLAGGLK